MLTFPYQAIVITRYKSPPGTPPVLLLQDDHVTIQSGDEDWLTGTNAEGKEIVIPASLVEKIEGSEVPDIKGNDVQESSAEQIGGNLAQEKQSDKEVVAPSDVESSTSSTNTPAIIPPVAVSPVVVEGPTAQPISSSPSSALPTEKSTITSTPLSPISTTPTSIPHPSPTLTSSLAASPQIIKSIAPDAPAKPMSLRDRINALNAAGAGALSPSSAPLPPVPRPKPTFSKKPFVTPASSTPTESTSPSTTPSMISTQSTSSPLSISSNLPSTASTSSSIKSAMSAEDAKSSIGASGGSLKDRIAALQGLKLDSAVAQIPTAPGRAPKIWKRKEVEPEPEVLLESELPVGKDESVKEETEKDTEINKELDLDPTPTIEEAERSDTTAILSPTEPTSTSPIEPNLTDEEEEAVKKAALVQRMASLGGQRVGMAMPALPKRAAPPRRKAPAAATVSVAAVAAAVSAPEIIENVGEEAEESKKVDDVITGGAAANTVGTGDTSERREKEEEDLSIVESNDISIPSSSAVKDKEISIPVSPAHFDSAGSKEEDVEIEVLPSPPTALLVDTELKGPIPAEPLTPLSMAIQQVLNSPSSEPDHTTKEAGLFDEPEEAEIEARNDEAESKVTSGDSDSSSAREVEFLSVANEGDEILLEEEEVAEEDEESQGEEEEQEENEVVLSPSVSNVLLPPSPITSRPPIPLGRPAIPAAFSPPPAQIEREVAAPPKLPSLPPPSRPTVSIPVAQTYDIEGVAAVPSIIGRREMLEKTVELKSPISSTVVDEAEDRSRVNAGVLDEATDSQLEEKEEEEEMEEEDPEVVRRAALAKRMAALGGMNMRMGPMFPPVGGLRKPKSALSNSESSEIPRNDESTSPASTRSGEIPSRGVLMPGMSPRQAPPPPEAIEDATVEGEEEEEEHEEEQAEGEEGATPPPLPIGRPPVPSPSKSLPPPPPSREAPTHRESFDSTSSPPLPSGRPILPPLRQFVEEPTSVDAEEIIDSTTEEAADERYNLPRQPSTSSLQSIPNSSIRSLSPSLSPPSRQLPQPHISNVEASSPVSSPRHTRNKSVAQSERSLGYSEKSSGGQKAKELDLESSTWWLQIPFGPPEFLKAADDSVFSTTESELNHGLHNNQIQVIYDDLSTTLVNIAFDDNNNHADIQQTHSPAPSPSLPQLLTFSSKLGSQLFAAAHSLKSSTSKYASPTSFVDECYSRATEILSPVGSCYGFTVYSVHIPSSSDKKLAQPIIEEIDTPRVGDIVVVNSAKFKHNLATVKVGTDKPEVAVLESYDSKKRKIKVLEVGKDGSVIEGGYRLEDLKSGSVKIFRAIPRSLLD